MSPGKTIRWISDWSPVDKQKIQPDRPYFFYYARCFKPFREKYYIRNIFILSDKTFLRKQLTLFFMVDNF